MSKRLLAITGSFVPYNDTVTLLSYKHLRLLDYQIDVLALKGDDDLSIQRQLDKDPNYTKFNVEYVTDYDKAIANMKNKNVIGGLFNMAKYVKACITKYNEHKHEVVYSSSIPAFTHIAAYMIKRSNKNVTWIASFSDPIVNSPYKKDKETLAEYNLITKVGFHVYILIYMNNIYERVAMKYADKIIYVSDEQRDFMIDNNPQIDKQILMDKALVVPFNYIKDWDVYNQLIVDQPHTSQNKPLIATHFGRIYGLRKIDNFLLALQKLNEEIIDLQDKIVFQQYGEIIPRYQKMIRELKLEKLFVCYDRVAYNIVSEKMKACDVLMLFDTITNDDQPQPYLPSKILEYIILRKPILSICQKNSPTYRILSDLGHECLENDVNDIVVYLRKIINSLPKYDYDINSYENENVPRII